MHIQDNIEFALTYYNEIDRAVLEKRLDPNVPKTGGGSSGHSRVSDPTCQKALQNVCEVEKVVVYYGCNNHRTVTYPERWVDVARATRSWYSNKIQGKIINRRFKDIPDRRADVCEELGIGTSYYSSMLKDIFTFATAYAAGKGLTKIKSKVYST